MLDGGARWSGVGGARHDEYSSGDCGSDLLANFPSVDDLVFADAPDVRHANIALPRAELDSTPAVAALADPADVAVLGEVTRLGTIIGTDAHGARIARLDDGGAAITEQRHQHPALRSVRVLDQPPILIFLDHADGQVSALIEPDAGIILPRAGAGHGLAARDRRPIGWRLVLLRDCGRGNSNKQECSDRPLHPAQAPVRIRSTNCFTVGMKPLE